MARNQDTRNTIGNVTDLHYCDADLNTGISDETPTGAHRSEHNNNGDTVLNYEEPRVKPDWMDDDYFAEEQAREKESMQGGFIERPGLSIGTWGKSDVERN